MVNQDLKIIRIREIPNNFSSDAEPDSPTPSLLDIKNFFIKEESLLRIYKVVQNDQTIGVMPFTIHCGRVNGLTIKHLKPIGWNFFDYIPIFLNKKELLEPTLKLMAKEARKDKVEAIHIPQLWLNNFSFPNKYIKTYTTQYFDAGQATSGWDEILRKKSMKRHRNKAMSQSSYNVDIHVGTVPDDEFEFIKETHVERWKFESAHSPFVSLSRIMEYKSFSNKILLKISINNKWLAYHYGLLFGKSMLWHTPVINIKYLKYSPLEVLLFETVSFCKKNDFNVLDFGLGDENYKERFCNNQQKIAELFYPISLRCHFLNILKQRIDFEALKLKKEKRKQSLRSAYHRVKNLKNQVLIYNHTPSETKKVNSSLEFITIKDYEDFISFGRRHKFELKKWQWERFRENSEFHGLLVNGEIACYGWASTKENFYIAEVNRSYNFDDNIILFDFLTISEFRGKGLYQNLLKNILNLNLTRTHSIYSLKSNLPSLKAIEKVGFTLHTKLTSFSIAD